MKFSLSWMDVDSDVPLDGLELFSSYSVLAKPLSDSSCSTVSMKLENDVLGGQDERIVMALGLYDRVVLEVPAASHLKRICKCGNVNVSHRIRGKRRRRRSSKEPLSSSCSCGGLVADCFVDTFEGAGPLERRLNVGRSWCEYGFLRSEALERVCNGSLGEALAKGAVLLVPRFEAYAEEAEWEEYLAWDGSHRVGYVGREANPYEYADLVEPIWRVLSSLAGLDRMGVGEGLVCGDFSIPVLSGIGVGELLALKADEEDAYGRWRRYLRKELRAHSSDRKVVSQALSEGLNELRDRLTVLKRKGTLDAAGAVLSSAAAAAVSLGVDAHGAALIGTLTGAGALICGQLKALYECRVGIREVKNSPHYFSWILSNNARSGH